MKNYYLYILASQKNGTLYIGRTENLAKRIHDHKNNIAGSFTEKYAVKNLVYYEIYENPDDAASREINMKKWKRQWKIKLIEENNPEWDDLYYNLNQ